MVDGSWINGLPTWAEVGIAIPAINVQIAAIVLSIDILIGYRF